jgi:poly(beta-D-mannuronate) lyase
MRRIQSFLLIFYLFPAAPLFADIKVSSLPELQRAIDEASSGAKIILANGVYTSSNAISISVKGTARKPIVIAAESVGGVEISGGKGFELVKPATYVTIEGFKFTHTTGREEMGGGEFVGAGANHCRFTRNVFDLTGQSRGYYLMVSGDDTEIDHNTFQNKFTVGQMIIVHGPSTNLMAQRTWIHHNCFTNFPDTHQNNCSAIQIGVSGRSLSPARSLVEHNLFLACRGENENICNKSCDNVYRFNTFGRGCSELSLRHGNRNFVYANFFIGSEGIRIFGKNDWIYSNYFEDCRRGIHIGNGDGVVPPSKLTSHDRPDGIEIVFNTLVNCTNSVMMQARRNGLGATNIVFANNIIVGNGKPVTIDGPMTHSKWAGNILWGDTSGIENWARGFKIVDPMLVKDATGEFCLPPDSPAVGKAIKGFAYVNVDMDGQKRGWRHRDVGADEYSLAVIVNRILTPTDVGVYSP